MQPFGPAGDDAVQRKADRFTALHGTVEHRAVEQRAVIMHVHRVRGLGRNRARALFQHLILESAGGGFHFTWLAIGGGGGRRRGIPSRRRFVVPYLTPMLENSGASVWLPRERDLGSKEIIVDAGKSSAGSEYLEEGARWEPSSIPGFGFKYPFLFDGENPFRFGHAKTAVSKSQADAVVKYLPEIPETGCFAVYVSYIQDDNNVPDAHYTVNHTGGKTVFAVNQTIGGGDLDLSWDF